MKLEYIEQAISDLEAIVDYLKPHNPSAAVKAQPAILAMLRNLRFPLSWALPNCTLRSQA
jgi:plasmid stabilization system protein ParE